MTSKLLEKLFLGGTTRDGSTAVATIYDVQDSQNTVEQSI